MGTTAIVRVLILTARALVVDGLRDQTLPPTVGAVRYMRGTFSMNHMKTRQLISSRGAELNRIEKMRQIVARVLDSLEQCLI